MKAGFFLSWDLGSLKPEKNSNVYGEEIMAEGLCNALNNIEGIEYAHVYAKNKMPEEKLDVLIYLNYTETPDPSLAKKSICYIQNGFSQNGNIAKLYNYVKQKSFDAYFVFSSKIYDFFKAKGEKVYFLPFAVDTNMYKPVEYDNKFDFDVAYVGNDIKGKKRTERFLLPATKFNMGLYGNWTYSEEAHNIIEKLKKSKRSYDIYDFCIFIKALLKLKSSKPYQRKLAKISKGKIPQDDMITLLSSSKILLNFTLQAAVDYDVINYRILEILACKGFVITDKTPIAQKLLKDCVVFTSGKKDLERKIKYYLKHPEKRHKYAQKGYEYVLNNCTANARAKEVYDFSRSLLN